MTKQEEMLKSVKYNLSRLNPLSKFKKDKKQNIEKILQAIEVVDRKYFVDKPDLAYIDSALPIGNGQTISQPSTVAEMLYIAQIKEGNDILEIGSGSGWNAAITAYITYPGKVSSFDIIPDLVENAQHNISRLKLNLAENEKKRLSNVIFEYLNIFDHLNDWDEKYDKIIITAGTNISQKGNIERLAENLLKDNGRLLAPNIEGPIRIIDKKYNKLKISHTKQNYRFVPLFTEH